MNATKNNKFKTLTSTLNTVDGKSTLYFGLDYQHTDVLKKGLPFTKPKKMEMDIDILCLLFDKNKQWIDSVWFKQLRDKTESIRHHGDQLRGRRPAHETIAIETLQNLEQIEIRLATIADEVHHIALLVNSYTKHPLSMVKAGEIYLQDYEANYLLRQNLKKLDKNNHSLYLASLTRNNIAHKKQDKQTNDTAVTTDWHINQKLLNVTADMSQTLDAVADEVVRNL